MQLNQPPQHSLEFFEKADCGKFTPKQTFNRYKKFIKTYFSKNLEIAYYNLPHIVNFVYDNNHVVTVKGNFAQYLTK
jgi:hypothetical protein